MQKPTDINSYSFQNRKTIIAAFAFIIALITFVAYIPALNNGFVNWDDPEYVTENPNIRSLDLRFFKWAATAVVNANWHPLTVLSHAIDYSIWGLNPWGHHLTSVIFHALNTSLVFILTIRLADYGNKALKKPATLDKKALSAGIIASILFGLHPLHVESVAWVSERKDVLSAFFFLLSVLGYLKYTSQKKAFYYLTALFFFILALISKPMAITLPVVLLILDWYPLKRFELEGVKKPIAEKIPFLMLSALSAALTIWAQKQALMKLESYPLSWRVPLALRSTIFYLYKMVLPFNLVPFYPQPLRHEFYNIWLLASFIVFLAITVFCVFAIKRRRIFPAAWLYYLITLTPVIGIVQVGSQAAADRYTYLPSLSLFIIAAIGGGSLLERLGEKQFIILTAAIAFVLTTVLSTVSIRQEAIWKDSLTLWSYEIDKYPRRVFIAHYNRGFAYEKLGDFTKALEDYDIAVMLQSGMADPYINRGVTHGELGDYQAAIMDFNRALRINPGAEKIYLNRGVAYLSLGDFRLAAEDFKKAIELDPSDGIAYYDLALAYSNLGDPDSAVLNFKKAANLGLKEAEDFLNKQSIPVGD